MRLSRLFLVLLGCAALSACARTSPFIYDLPATYQGPPAVSSPISVVVLAVRDQRKDTSQDVYLEGSVRDEVRYALIAELESTGLCRADTAARPARSGQVPEPSLTIAPTLLEMMSYIPGHDTQINDMRRMGPAGGLAAFIAGTQDTVVTGWVKLRLEIHDNRTNELVLDRTYDGITRDRFVVFRSDRPDTKAVMMGRALKVALEKAKADLTRAVPAVAPGAGTRP